MLGGWLAHLLVEAPWKEQGSVTDTKEDSAMTSLEIHATPGAGSLSTRPTLRMTSLIFQPSPLRDPRRAPLLAAFCGGGLGGFSARWSGSRRGGSALG